MKTLLNCDEVFDRLTRGPFPSGAPDDPSVERHLEACHECRQLAEALRPAVNLFRDASAGADLPVYRGCMPELDRARDPVDGKQAATVVGVSRPPASDRLASDRLASDRLASDRPGSDQRQVAALLAAVLLGVACGVWASRGAGGDVEGAAPPGALVAWRSHSSSVGESALREPFEGSGRGGQGEWETPKECRSHSPAFLGSSSTSQQHCCTLCHSAQSPRNPHFAASRFVAACLACHKG